MILLLSFIAFLASFVGMAMMIYRAFPRLVDITVVEHRKFALFGIENVHILEYKEPTAVFRKKLFISLEKILRRVRGWVLKLDTALSRSIEFVQQKIQAAILPRTDENHESRIMNQETRSPETAKNAMNNVPTVSHSELPMVNPSTAFKTGEAQPENLLVIREKPKTPPRGRRIVRDITGSTLPIEKREGQKDISF